MVTLAHIKEQSRLNLGRYGRLKMTEELKEIGLNMADQLIDGRSFRTLKVLDDFNRESALIEGLV